MHEVSSLTMISATGELREQSGTANELYHH